MKRQLTVLALCAGILVAASACATKGFVREQVGTSETRLTQRVETQTAANRQAIEAAGQQIQGLDTRVGGLDSRVNEVGTVASEARKDAAAVGQAQREAETQFSQRFANRNKYATVETKIVFFDFNKADLRDEGINELEDLARALKADPNAVLELQGFADPRGTDRYNYALTRERVDAVVRYLVQRHGIDLRRIYAVGMGKIAPAAGEKPSKETFAKSRRVELRLLAPQS